MTSILSPFKVLIENNNSFHILQLGNKKSIATEKKRMDQTITKGKQLEDQPEEYMFIIIYRMYCMILV